MHTGGKGTAACTFISVYHSPTAYTYTSSMHPPNPKPNHSPPPPLNPKKKERHAHPATPTKPTHHQSMGGYRFYVRGYDDEDFPAFGALTGATLEARLPLMLMASGKAV
jgi:hypothetical protein